MNDLFARLEGTMLIPVIALENAGFAEGLADALCRAGIPAAEVTFRTASAAETIRRMKLRRPEMLVGAGTVLTVEQAARAIEAGAEFLVSPGLNPKVLEFAIEKKIPMVPGVCTPSEIEQGLSYGLKVLKFFPAEASGGLGMIKAVSAPYSMVRFMPTGGISEKNIAAYLANEKVLCCGGSWIVPKDALSSGDFAAVEALSRAAVRSMLGFSVLSVSGMSKSEALAALQEAGVFPDEEDFPVPDAGDGEIVLATPVLFRAAARFRMLGLEGEEEKNEKGKPVSFALKRRIGGARIVLKQK